MTSLVKAGIGAVLVALLGWWAWSSFRPTTSEELAVWKERAAVAEAEVADLKPKYEALQARTHQVDTIVRVVLRTPPPVRPVTPTRPVLDSLDSDSLKALVGVLEAYADTVTKENVALRAVLDTTASVFVRYREAADSTIAAQARQIQAHKVIIDVQECRILGLLKCPSRKVVAIGSAVLTAGAVLYVKR